MPNDRLAQWIFLSGVEFFRQELEVNAGFVFFVEGEHRTTDKETELVEYRMDGPFAHKINHNLWWHNVEINVLITVVKTEDVGKVHLVGGTVLNAFKDDIPVFKFGPDETLDDGTFVGCLRRRKELRERAIVLSHFGQLEPSLNLLQATVEGHYRLELDEE